MPEIGEIQQGRKVGKRDSHKHIWTACLECGKERWVTSVKGTPKNQRCLLCHNRRIIPIGKNHPLWKGGRVKTTRGYITVRLYPDDFFYQMTNTRGYVSEHRLVVAEALGRNLHKWEIVHHKHAKYPARSIEDKQDNRYPENLQLVSDDRHKQITILENRIQQLEKRVLGLEADNILLRANTAEATINPLVLGEGG